MAPSKLYLEKSKKACEAMKRFDVTPRKVRSALKPLLLVYQKNWTYIEDDDYKVLIDAIFEPEGPKNNEIVQHGFEFYDDPEEDEEVEPLIRRPRFRSNDASCSNPAGYSCENAENLCLEYNNMNKNTNNNNNNINNNNSNIENENDVPPSPLSSEFDIASSSNGEVKFTFSVSKPPLGSITSHEYVTNRVEDIYQDLFHGFGTGLSLAQVLKKICQGFTEQGNANIIIPKNYTVDDITRGLEKENVSLVNEVDNETPPAFKYMQKNVSRYAANVNAMHASISDENCCPDCFGDCLSSEVACACAGRTGGEFAYTKDGLVEETFLKRCVDIVVKPTKEDYFYCDDCPLERLKRSKTETNRSPFGSCKGHLVRMFIKECWHKCDCGRNCGNRVVQRGIRAKLQVFMTPEGKGWGLRTLEDLPRGAFVCEYVGEVVTNSELFEQEQSKSEQNSHIVVLDAGWSSQRFVKDNEALYLDATSFGNVARFINHRCVDANMVEIPVEVEPLDQRYYHHAFFTTREVKAMEELTWDYGIAFDDDSHPVKAFTCKCGSKLCKAIKRYKRSRRGAASDNQIVARMELESCSI